MDDLSLRPNDIGKNTVTIVAHLEGSKKRTAAHETTPAGECGEVVLHPKILGAKGQGALTGS